MSFWYGKGAGRFAKGMMGLVFAVCCVVCLPVVAAPVTAMDRGRSADNVCRAELLKDEAVSREVAAIRKRAMDGDEVSLMVAGMMYDSGFMVKRDLDEAVFWYEKAEAKGIWDAFLPLAFAYAEKGDLEKARVFFDKASRLYLFSSPVGKLQEAFAAELADSRVMDTCSDRKRINEKRLAWLEGLANGGNPMACAMMAVLYDKGFGVKKDAVRSGQWCLKMKAFDVQSTLPKMVCDKD